MTNGDKLRAMTNKQLASFHSDHCCPPGEEDTTDCTGCGSKCKKHWLEWLEKEEIKVGDEVEATEDGNMNAFAVVIIVKDNIFGITTEGKWAGACKDNIRKTGRHFPQIAEVLEQMKGD